MMGKILQNAVHHERKYQPQGVLSQMILKVSVGALKKSWTMEKAIEVKNVSYGNYVR